MKYVRVPRWVVAYLLLTNTLMAIEIIGRGVMGVFQ